MKVHLIDGTYELFRAFYGPPSAKAPDGREVGATRGLLRSFAALLREPDVTHVAVAFDHVVESFRNELFAGYKTGEGIDPDLWSQFPLAERATKALGLVTWPMVEFEADDAIATAAARFADVPEVTEVRLCSPDKDLTQCVRGDRVVLWDRKADKVLNQEAVREKFGVEPTSIPDYLALVGDTADGIPGIPRWGAKSTAKVLARWEHIDRIPEDPEAWEVKVRGARGLAEELAARRDEAALYRRLATLREDVPLEASLEDLEWRGAPRDALESFAAEIGDDRLLDRVERWA